MSTTRILKASAAALAVALLLGPVGAAVAGVKVDEETKKKLEGKDDEKGPDSEGNGEGKPPAPKKNPLPEIIELMRKAEQRLAESESDQWTTDEQQKVVDALEGQQGAAEQLKKLIEDLEDQAQSGGGGSGSSSGKKPKQGKGGGQKQQGQKQKDDGQKSLDPSQQKPNQQQKDPGKRGNQNQKTDEQRRLEEAARTPQDPMGDQPARTGDKTQTWGNLAPKAQGEAISASKKPMPPEYQKQLIEYYKRLRETKPR